jgi:CRISPR/Cas system-associated endoribonuclease Cas2
MSYPLIMHKNSKVKKNTIEHEALVVRRNTNIRHVLLHTVAIAGVLSVAVLAPNALRVIKMFDKGKARRMNPKYLFAPTFQKLIAKGHLEFVTKNGKKHVRLTEEGKHQLVRMVARSPDTRIHKRWDKRWRMVIYDIREERKQMRKELQSLLRNFGFMKLQNSVWVYPHDCEALVVLLKANFKVGQEVLYVVVEKIENDTLLKKHFEIK